MDSLLFHHVDHHIYLLYVCILFPVARTYCCSTIAATHCIGIQHGTDSLPPGPVETVGNRIPLDRRRKGALPNDEQFASYRLVLEQWMQNEKPYLNPDFKLLDLRQVLPLNRTYLSQLINKEYNCNFYQFVTKYRIDEAMRLMKEHPDIKMQEVAERSGFSSSTVFGRTFSRETGQTPHEWSSNLNNS